MEEMGVRRLESHDAGMLKEETCGEEKTIGKLAAIAKGRAGQGRKELQSGGTERRVSGRKAGIHTVEKGVTSE